MTIDAGLKPEGRSSRPHSSQSRASMQERSYSVTDGGGTRFCVAPYSPQQFSWPTTNGGTTSRRLTLKPAPRINRPTEIQGGHTPMNNKFLPTPKKTPQRTTPPPLSLPLPCMFPRPVISLSQTPPPPPLTSIPDHQSLWFPPRGLPRQKSPRFQYCPFHISRRWSRSARVHRCFGASRPWPASLHPFSRFPANSHTSLLLPPPYPYQVCPS